MSHDLSALLISQLEIQGRISRSVENLRKMGASHITLSAVETRSKLLDQLWAKFEAQHDQIRATYRAKFATSEYALSDCLELTEMSYVAQKSQLAGHATELSVASRSPSSSRDLSNDPSHRTALPRIKLLAFSGKYKDWPSFRDLFLSLIGENSAITNVERLHYLRSSLQGPAEKLICSLAVSGDNYARAWAILCSHYENKREIIRSNFSNFTTVPRMKGDSAEELSRIYNAVTATVNAHESIGRPINSHGMDLFSHLVVELFDTRTRLEWETSTSNLANPPEHDTLMNFISKRILTLNAAKPRLQVKPASDRPRPVRSHTVGHKDLPHCALCNGTHTLMHCSSFKAKSAKERKEIIEANRLCYNCLGNHLVARCQSTKTCFSCKERHHSLLHSAYAPSNVNVMASVQHHGEHNATLLATARLTVNDNRGDPQKVRALLDQESEVSIITESLAQRLRLTRRRTLVAIYGVGGSRPGSTRGRVKMCLTSEATGASLTVEAFVLPRLSLYQGPTEERRSTWPHIRGLALADPRFNTNDPIELLLGAEVCLEILKSELRRGSPGAPIAQKTTLGWILSGGCGATSPHSLRGSLQCSVDLELGELVQRFWEQEKEPSFPTALTPEVRGSFRSHSSTNELRAIHGAATVLVSTAESRPD